MVGYAGAYFTAPLVVGSACVDVRRDLRAAGLAPAGIGAMSRPTFSLLALQGEAGHGEEAFDLVL